MSTLPPQTSDAPAQEALRRATEFDRDPAPDGLLLDEPTPPRRAAAAGGAAVVEDSASQRERAAFERDRRVAFGVHLGLYIAVNFLLMVLNLINDQSWFIWVLFGWGLILTVHGFSLAQKEGLAYDNSFQQWKLYEGDGADEPAH